VAADKPIRLLSKQERQDLQTQKGAQAWEELQPKWSAVMGEGQKGQNQNSPVEAGAGELREQQNQSQGQQQNQSQSAQAAQKVESMRAAALLRVPSLERERPTRRRLIGVEATIRGFLWMLSLACVIFYLGMASWDYSHVEVPELQGLSTEQAVQRLEEKDLIADITIYRSSPYPEGEIIGQTPSLGERVQRDSVVELVVSTGLDGFEIPNLIGQDQDTALRTLERLGLQVRVEQLQTEEPAGTVLLTAPPSGTRILDTSDPDEAHITLYVATHVLSAGLVDFRLTGLQVAIEPRYTLTPAGDISFDVARRLSSLFEAADADVSITRSSREHVLEQDELDSRAARLAPQLHIILTVRDTGPSGVIVRSADDSEDSTGRLIYQRLLDNQIDASFVQSETFGMAGISNSVEVVLGNTSHAEDVNRFTETFWRDHVARAIYMAASPQFSLER